MMESSQNHIKCLQCWSMILRDGCALHVLQRVERAIGNFRHKTRHPRVSSPTVHIAFKSHESVFLMAGVAAEDSTSRTLSVNGDRRSKEDGKMSSCFRLTRRAERGVVG